MKVAAIIVTKGDQDLTPIVTSLPEEWEVVIWDNSQEPTDLAVYGRYAAIERTDADLIYVQDDDCVVSDPQAIVDSWHGSQQQCEGDDWDPRLLWSVDSQDVARIGRGEHVACNMPSEFRHEFYEEHALVGFGAVFHRDAPSRAFDRFFLHDSAMSERVLAREPAMQAGMVWKGAEGRNPYRQYEFYRTCDIVFTGLTPRVLVDVPKENLPWAYFQDRMYRQSYLLAERVRMLDLVRQIR